MASTHIAVLIVPPIQLLDLAPVDLFAMLTHSYFQACSLPADLLAASVPDDQLKISYVGASSDAPTTARLNIGITTSLTDPSVAPGKVDILLIPGPPPGMQPSEEVLEFVRGHVKVGVDLLTVCSGVWVAAFAGVLEGKTAVAGRGMRGVLEAKFPGVTWVDKRYAQDGRVWTSGGITNGMDLVGWYLRERWPGVLSEAVLGMAEVKVRDAEYVG